MIKSSPFVLILDCCFFFSFSQNSQVLNVFLCDDTCRDFMSTPTFFLSRMHRAQIPTDDAVWHLTGSPQSTPIAAAKHLPACCSMAVMSVTSHWRQSHTPTRTTCPDFSEDWGPNGKTLPSFYIIHVICNSSSLLSVTEDYLQGLHSVLMVCISENSYFWHVVYPRAKVPCSSATTRRHLHKKGFLLKCRNLFSCFGLVLHEAVQNENAPQEEFFFFLTSPCLGSCKPQIGSYLDKVMSLLKSLPADLQPERR